MGSHLKTLKIQLLLLFLVVAHQLTATHLLGGYLSYSLVNPVQCEITVHLLTDTGGGDQAGEGMLDFGDGTTQTGGFDLFIEEKGSGINLVSFTVLHTYVAFGSYEISYVEPNYSTGINNIEQSSNVPFFVAARVEIGPLVQTNQSPVLRLFSHQKGISGVQQRINPAAFDADGDSLSYELIVPRQDQGTRISGYSFPNDAIFYVDFNAGNEAGDGPPVYVIDPATGEILWDAPELLGDYGIAYTITQWRKAGNVWQDIGESEVVLIDRIADAGSEVLIEGPDSQCFEEISGLQEQFLLRGPAGQTLTVQVFSDLEGGLINGTPIDPDEVLSFSLNGSLTLSFTIPTGLILAPFKPYKVVIVVETAFETFAFSWALAVGCDDLPDGVPPNPVSRDKTCEELQIYPNPVFRDLVKICIPNGADQTKHLRIVDIQGKILFQQDVAPATALFNLDVSDLQSGLYILQVGQWQTRFVVAE